jgi:tetratricopeptide (TPR) repeat protein
MSQISSLIVERFKRLPRLSDDRWQGGLARVPSWIERGPDGKPYRPWAGIWVSLKTGMINLKLEPEPGAHDWTLALDALLEFGLKRGLAGCRPGGLEVADEELGSRLLNALGDRDLGLTVSRDLPAVRRVLAVMSEQVAGAPPPPDALDAPGVTVDRMRAFAEATKRFYEAAPWRYLSDEDLIHVEAPAVQRGLKHVTVLGAGGKTFGLGFFQSVNDHNEVQERLELEAFTEKPRWLLCFGPISEMPFGDADLWEERGLPVAEDDAYPVATRFSPDGKLRRPDAAVLSYLEGLLRALAETTENEIDQGRWTRRIETHDGPATFQLSIPSLLEPLDAPPVRPRTGLLDRRATERVSAEIERFMARSDFKNTEAVTKALQHRFRGPMDEIPSTAETPLEKAQELIYRAFEARGRRRIQLARKALDLSADCADAYVILAEHAGDLGRARDHYAQGVAAGERALGPRAFAEEAGHFWGLITTRPYMRARFGLAQCLEALRQTDEAIGHYRELLHLNPNDNQGVRDTLLPALLAAGQDDEAGTLLGQFRDDPTAIWRYGWALWTFRKEGDSLAARESLHQAIRANRRVPKYLTGEAALPDDDPPSYALGSEEEAVICAHALDAVWRATPGAGQWLATRTPAGKSRKGHRRSR